jgi:hypothetical protein
MKRNFSFLLSIIISSLIFGCASLSKNECLQADWFEIGRKDGVMGSPRALFQRHCDSCSKHDVIPDRDLYFTGRNEGLKVYCTEESGFEQGRLGRKYEFVCSGEFEQDFLAGYHRGREIYRYESKVATLDKRLKRIDRQIKAKEKELYSSDLTDERRAVIRAEIRSLDIEYRTVVEELNYLARSKPAF